MLRVMEQRGRAAASTAVMGVQKLPEAAVSGEGAHSVQPCEAEAGGEQLAKFSWLNVMKFTALGYKQRLCLYSSLDHFQESVPLSTL